MNIKELNSDYFLKFLETLSSSSAQTASDTLVVDFQKVFEKEEKALRLAMVQHHPLNLLSRLSYENLFNFDDIFVKGSTRLVLYHFEVLQFFVATNKEEWWQAAPKIPSTDDVTTHLETMVAAMALKHLQMLKRESGEHSIVADDAPAGGGYADTELKRILLRSLGRELETRIKIAQNDELFPVLSAKYFADIKLSRVKNADVQFQLALLRKAAQKKRWAIDKLKIQFREWWIFRLTEQFLFSIEEIKSICGIQIEIDLLKRVVDDMSLVMGAQETFDIEHLILANKIGQRPFLKIGDGKYGLFVPTIFD